MSALAYIIGLPLDLPAGSSTRLLASLVGQLFCAGLPTTHWVSPMEVSP
jgi:hypothetical protein